MGGLPGETNGSLVSEKDSMDDQTSNDVNIGELLWIKLNEASWWPAQIVDENLVISANKPSRKGLSSDVLVRIYGSYIYKYVDIPSASAEFKSMLIKNNFNYNALLKKSLEQDLPSLSSSKSRKRQQSKSKGKAVNESSQNGSSDKSPVSSKKRKQETKNPKPTPDQVQHGTESSTPNNSTRRPQELSARRVKVMQSLGLVAPSGSPFPHNRVIPANPTFGKVVVWCKMTITAGNSVKESLNSKKRQVEAKRTRPWAKTSYWSLWKVRNDRIFNRIYQELEKLQ